eukprot:scaffold67023_cov62-Phaeocystis_antarctica.AAC.2
MLRYNVYSRYVRLLDRVKTAFTLPDSGSAHPHGGGEWAVGPVGRQWTDSAIHNPHMNPQELSLRDLCRLFI